MHHEHERKGSKFSDSCEILDRIIGQLLQAGIDGKADRGDEQGMSVGRRLCYRVGPDRAAARTIVDDDGLSPAFREALRHQPRDVVSGASGDERHDELDLLSGIVLGDDRRCGRECRRRQQRTKRLRAM